MKNSLSQLREYEKMVSGFEKRNKVDAALDTAAIITAVWTNLPVLWVLLLPACINPRFMPFL